MINILENKLLMTFIVIGALVMISCIFFIIYGTSKIMIKKIKNPNKHPQSIRRLDIKR